MVAMPGDSMAPALRHWRQPASDKRAVFLESDNGSAAAGLKARQQALTRTLAVNLRCLRDR
jgi:hypothetical protein